MLPLVTSEKVEGGLLEFLALELRPYSKASWTGQGCKGHHVGQGNLGGSRRGVVWLKSTRNGARRTGYKPLLYFLLVVDPEFFAVPTWASFSYELWIGIIIHGPQGCYKDLLVGGSEVLLFFCRWEREHPKLRTRLDWAAGSWRTSVYIPSCRSCSHLPYSPASVAMDDTTWLSAEQFLVWRGYESLCMVYILFWKNDC